MFLSNRRAIRGNDELKIYRISGSSAEFENFRRTDDGEIFLHPLSTKNKQTSYVGHLSNRTRSVENIPLVEFRTR